MSVRGSLPLSLGALLVAASGGPARADADARPSLAGPVGPLHMSAAEVGAVDQLRLGLEGEFFRGSGVLVSAPGTSGDRETRLRGGLVAGLTPLPFLELFASLNGGAHRNRRICAAASDGVESCVSEPGRSDPEVIKSLGALTFGGKIASPLGARGVSGGVELGVRVHSSVNGLSIDPDATSGWVTGLAGWNLRRQSAIPVRVHGAVGFLLDNSYRLLDFGDMPPSSQLVHAFARGMGRPRARAAVGVESRLNAGGVTIHPSLGYTAEVVTGDGLPAFAAFGPDRCEGTTMSPCRDNRDQQWLTFGVTARTRRGLAVALGFDLAVRRVGLLYGAPIAPYSGLLAISQALDLSGRPVTRVIEKVVVVSPAPRDAIVTGQVAAPDGSAVEGAVLKVAGREQPRVATDAQGRFQLSVAPPGPVTFEVTAAGFETARLQQEIAAGRRTDVKVSLRRRASAVTARLLDRAGQGRAGVVHVSGPAGAEEVATDAEGRVALSLPAGAYDLRAEVAGHVPKRLRIAVPDGAELALGDLVVHARPPAARVTMGNGELSFQEPFGFAAAEGRPSAELPPDAEPLLDEVVELLALHPEIRRLRVEAHWDSSLPAHDSVLLTHEQAKAVTAYLVRQGVPADRLEAVGMGATKPSTKPGRSRARHRRVELRIVDQTL